MAQHRKAVQISDPKIRSMSFVVNKGDEEWEPRNPEARFLSVKATAADIEAAKNIVTETRKAGGNDVLAAIRIMSSRGAASKAGPPPMTVATASEPTRSQITAEMRKGGCANQIHAYMRAVRENERGQ